MGDGDGRYVALLELDAAEKFGADDEIVLRRYGRGEREGCRLAIGDLEREGDGDGGASSVGMFIAMTTLLIHKKGEGVNRD